MILAPAVRRGHARRRRLGPWPLPAAARVAAMPVPAEGHAGTLSLSTPALVARAVMGAVVSLLLSATVAALAWSTVPVLFGLDRVVIAGDSMVPALTRGDLVYLEPGAERIAPGAVITFDSPTGSGLVTHRVVKDFGDGSLLTRGDANVMSDSDPVPVASVRGVALVRVPVVGSIAPQGFVAAGAAMFAALLVLRAVLRVERRSRRWRPTLRLSPSVGVATVVVVALVGQASNAGATGLASTTAANSGNSFSTVFEVASTTSVNPQLGVVGTVNASVVFDGVVYVTGDFTTLNEAGAAPVTRRILAAFDATSGALLDWNPVVVTTPGSGSALAVDPVNRYLYVGGNWTVFPSGVGPANNERLWRYTIPAGAGSTPVAAPTPMGVTNGVVNALVVDGSGNLYAGGSFTTVTGGPTRNRLAAWGADGTLSSWNPNLSSNQVLALHLLGDRLYVGGDFSAATIGSGPTVTVNRVAALGAIGSVSPPAGGALSGFAPAPSNAVWAIATDGAGKLWIGGAFSTIDGSSRVRIAQLDPLTGAPTPMLSTTGGSIVYALTYDPARDLIYVGSDGTTVGGKDRRRVGAIRPDTGVALRWDPEADSGAVRSIQLLGADRVVLAGSFASMGATDRQSLALVAAPDAGPEDVVNPGVTLDAGAMGTVNATALVGTTLYVVGNFTWLNGVRRLRAAAIDTTTGAVLPWDPQLDNTAWSVAVSGSRVYIGGDFTAAGITSTPRPVARLGSFDAVSAAVDTGFVAGADSTVRVLKVAGGRLYAAGTFGSIGGQSRLRFASLDPVTGSVGTINPQLNNTVHDIAIDGNLAYLVGTFTAAAGVTRDRFAVWDLGSNTLVNTPSVPSFPCCAIAVEVDAAAGRIYIGGQFTSVDTTPPTGAVTRNRLAALDRTSFALVAGFAPTVNCDVVDLEVPATGTVFAGGCFTDVGGNTARDMVAAFDAAGTVQPWIGPTYPGTGPAGTVRVVTTDPNVANRWWVAGSFQATIGGQAREALAQVDGPISGPTSAGPAVLPAATSRAAVRTQVRVGNTLYLGGSFRYVNGQLRVGLAAIDLATNTLLPWAPNPTWTNSAIEVNALATNPAGTVLYAGGTFGAVGGTTRNNLAAFDLGTGALSAFNPNVNTTVNALTVLSGGDLLIGGSFSNVGGVARNRFARLDPTGALRPLTVSVNNNIVWTIATDPTESTIYLGGSFNGANSVGAATRNRAAAVDAATGAVLPWNPDPNSTVRSALVAADGATVHLGGEFTMVAATSPTPVLRNRGAAVNASTGAPTAWDPNLNAAVRAMRFAPTGEVILAGDFTTVGSVTRAGLAAVTPDTGALHPWNPALGGTNIAMHSLGATATGDLVVGGDYLSFTWSTTAGSVSVIGMPAAIAAPAISNPRLITISGTNPTNNAVAVVGTRAHVVGSFTAMLDPATGRWQPRRRYAVFDVLTGAPVASVVGFDSAPNAVVTSADGSQVYVVGGFTLASSAETRVVRNRAAGVSTSTGALTAWNPDANNFVHALTADPVDGTVYLGGDFTLLATTTSASTSRSRLAAVDPVTGAPTAWNPGGPNNSVRALTLSPDRSTLYVGGLFTTLGGTARSRLGSVTTAGTGSLTSFDPGPSDSVFATALDESGTTLFAAGQFLAVAAGATTRNRAAAWSVPSGTLTPWNPNLNSTVQAVVKLPGGSVYLGGTFTTVNGSVTRNRFAAVDTNLGAVTTFHPGGIGANNGVNGLAVSVANRRLVAVGGFTTLGGSTPTRSGVAVLE